MELPQECRCICMHHSMSYLLEFLIWFYPWISEEISIYGRDLVCLAELYWYTMVVLPYGGIYSFSSIDYCKVRAGISSMRQIVKQYFVIFFGFLKDMFWSEYISSNTIYCYEESPLTFWAFSPEEGSIQNKYRGSIWSKMRIETNIILLFWRLYFGNEFFVELSVYCFDGNLFCICKFSKSLFVERIAEKESMILLYYSLRYPSRISEYIATIYTLISLSSIRFTKLLDRFSLTFLTDFNHKNKIERINLSIMRKTREKTYQEMSIKPEKEQQREFIISGLSVTSLQVYDSLMRKL